MYFLGIEGGGTKSTGVLSDLAGDTVVMCVGAPSALSALGKDACLRSLDELVGLLLPDDDRSKIASTTFGLSGVGRQSQRDLLAGIAGEIGLRESNVLTDAELLHYSAHGNNPGIALISGTGSICVIRNHAENYRQFGGWGFLLGDKGSGFDLGKQAVRNALAEFEAGPTRSRLTESLLTFYGVDSPPDLISLVYHSENPQNLLASCAKLVCDLAESGQELAIKLVDNLAGDIADLCLRGSKSVTSPPPHRVALFGGLLQRQSPVRAAFMKSLLQRNLSIELVEPVYPPAAAAVAHAIQTAGYSAGSQLSMKLRQIGCGQE